MIFLNKDSFVIIANVEWDFLWQRQHALTKYISENKGGVFFVENTGFRDIKISDLSKMGQWIKRTLTLDKRKVYKNDIPRNTKILRPLVFPPFKGMERFFNKNIFLPQFINTFKKNITGKKIVISYLPTQTALEIINHIEPDILIYDCVVNFEAIAMDKKRYTSAEEKLLEKTDMVFVDSDFLFRKYSSKHANVIQFHHGCDYDLFSSIAGQKGDLKEVCYFGGINQHLNWDIIKGIANGGYKVKLYGERLLSNVPHHKNISYGGSFPQKELVDKISAAGSIILPYRTDTDFMKGVLPAKIYECLATGKPVLSTPLGNYNENIRENIYLCEDPAQFCDILQKIPELDEQAKVRRRLDLAAENSSTRVIGGIMKQVERYYGTKT